MTGFRIVNVVFWLALAVYLGGLVSLGAVAAPAIFGTVKAEHIVGARAGLEEPGQVGGEIFGNVLRRFAPVEWACLGTLAGAAVMQMWLWPGKEKGWMQWRKGLLAALVAVAVYDRTVTEPAVVAARTAWQEAMAHRPTAVAEHRERFTALHTTAERLAEAKVGLLAGIAVAAAWGMYDGKEKKKPVLSVEG